MPIDASSSPPITTPKRAPSSCLPTSWPTSGRMGCGSRRVFPFITLPSSAAGGAGRRALRPAIPDGQPAGVDAVAVPLELLGAGHGIPTQTGRAVSLRPGCCCWPPAAPVQPSFSWGYIAPRYLGDFVPFLVLAGAVAMVDIWRRLEGRTRAKRVGALVVIGVVALWAIVANIGMAITPNEEWNTTQVLHYVKAQKAVSDLTGHPLNPRSSGGARCLHGARPTSSTSSVTATACTSPTARTIRRCPAEQFGRKHLDDRGAGATTTSTHS